MTTVKETEPTEPRLLRTVAAVNTDSVLRLLVVAWSLDRVVQLKNNLCMLLLVTEQKNA